MTCRFDEDSTYYCAILKENIPSTVNSFKILGEHENTFLDDDKVNKLLIFDCNLPVLTSEFISAFLLKFKNIRVMEISYSEVDEIQPGAFSSAAKLELGIYRLEFLFNNLEYLRSGAFDGLEDLTTLDIRSSKLTYIQEGAFRSLRKLESLSLTRGRLQTLEPKIFQNLRKLKWISLDENQLKVLHGGLFDNNEGLKSVSLSTNRIEAVDPKLFRGLYRLKTIYLALNLCYSGANSFSREESVVKLSKCFENYEKLSQE